MSSPKTYIIIYVAKFNSVTLKFTKKYQKKNTKKILNFFQKIVDNSNKILYNIFCQLDAPLAQLVRATGS